MPWRLLAAAAALAAYALLSYWLMVHATARRSEEHTSELQSH